MNFRANTEIKEARTDLPAMPNSGRAAIEIVAALFQAILQEETLSPVLRLWFARLQMPVLRQALAEPEDFCSPTHTARLLVNRMASCAMGFHAGHTERVALEAEVRRIVTVIEQYPDLGKQAYELLGEEFEKFINPLDLKPMSTLPAVNVMRQMEQREALQVSYTIEMRNLMLRSPVRGEIRTFLFEIWTELLAVTAVRHGQQHTATLDLKKLASRIARTPHISLESCRELAWKHNPQSKELSSFTGYH